MATRAYLAFGYNVDVGLLARALLHIYGHKYNEEKPVFYQDGIRAVVNEYQPDQIGLHIGRTDYHLFLFYGGQEYDYSPVLSAKSYARGLAALYRLMIIFGGTLDINDDDAIYNDYIIPLSMARVKRSNTFSQNLDAILGMPPLEESDIAEFDVIAAYRR